VTPPYRVSQPAEFGFPVRTLPEDLVPGRSGAVSWWSDVKRTGDWVLPRIFRAFSCMGNIEIDLTSARMGAGESEMELNCVLGAVTVIVPPDIRIICDGDSLAGSFNVEHVGKLLPTPADAPTIRITGTAYFGAVTIRIVDPNAPGFLQKLKAGWASFNQ